MREKSGASLRLSFLGSLERGIGRIEKTEKHPSYCLPSPLGTSHRKISNAICVILGYHQRKASEMTEKEMNILVSALTSFESEVTGTRGWNEAEFTAGGVDGAG